MSTSELEQVNKAVAEFDRVAAGLKSLQEKYGGVVYDVATPAGMKDAKAARAEVREPRYEVERLRQAAKAPILALGRKLDTEAKRITTAILAIENPIAEQIARREQEIEAERQRKIDEELKRVQAIQGRIAELHGCPTLTPASGSALLAKHIGDLEAIPVDETFAEFRDQAETAKAAGLARLRELHSAAIAHEAEQARLRAEREELARLRAEEEARQAQERARLADEERIAKAARDEADRKARLEREAEAARQAEALRQERAEAERQEAIRRETREIEERSAREERARQEALIAAQREALAREQREARERQEAEERRLADERAAFEREQAARKSEEIVLSGAPTAQDVVEVLAAHYDEAPEVVLSWLRGMDFCALEIDEESEA